jgi:uncharacterized surface protein with fasciclin (FAS1) repeats
MKIGILGAGLVVLALSILALGTSQAQISPLAPTGNIAQIISKGVHFKKLSAALKLTGLDKILSGKGFYTLFAPSDAAFNKIPKATLTELLGNKTLLTKILLYHVVPGKLSKEDLINAKTIKTAEGSSVQISNLKNVLRVNKSRMAKSGVEASNGKIYVINLLLVPKK